MPDVMIVGGGPAGSMSARLLAEQHSVTVLENHQVSGLPLQCTGLISPDVITESGITPEIYNSFSRADFHFPNGKIFTLDCGRPVAHLIDRSGFDRKLADAAIDAGAEFRYSEGCSAFYVKDGSVRTISKNGNTYDSKLLIGADGHSSAVRRAISDFVPEMTVRGMQVDIRKEMDVQDTIQIVMGNEYAPGFFAWAIPFGEYTRVGLCCEWSHGTPSQYMGPLFRKLGISDPEVISKSAGKIPLGHLRRTYSDNVMLVGDSACQVKPISGGGLYPIMRASKHMCAAAEAAFAKDDFTADTLSAYQKAWEADIGKELRRGFKLRSMYNRLSDKDLNGVLKAIDRPFFREIALTADIDRPSDLYVRVMKHPLALMRLFPYLIKGVIG